jgi:hypothetical protein
LSKIGKRRRRIRDEEKRDHRHHRYGREVLLGMERQAWIEADVRRERAGRAEADRVAIGRALRHRLHAEIAAGAGTVFHDHLLAQPRRQARCQCACHQVRAAARRERDDEANRF